MEAVSVTELVTTTSAGVMVDVAVLRPSVLYELRSSNQGSYIVEVSMPMKLLQKVLAGG